MPSGAKKRKAAKKKKTQLHGEDGDPIVHDGKDSDSGDAADGDLHVAAVGAVDDDKEEERTNSEEDPPSVRSNADVESEPPLVENGESTLKVTTVEEEIPVESKPLNQDREIHEIPDGVGGDDDDDDDGSDSSSSSSSSKSSDEESQTIEEKKNIVTMEDLNESAALELSNPVLLVEQKDEELSNPVLLVEQKDEELAESPPSLLLDQKPVDLPAEIITQSKSVSDVIELDTAPLASEELVEIAKDEIAAAILSNNNDDIRLKEENDIKVDKQVSTTVLETTTVTATVQSSSTVVSTAVANNVIDQPRVVVTIPKPTQRTSLASCCGLFELFTGSNR